MQTYTPILFQDVAQFTPMKHTLHAVLGRGLLTFKETSGHLWVSLDPHHIAGVSPRRRAAQLEHWGLGLVCMVTIESHPLQTSPHYKLEMGLNLFFFSVSGCIGSPAERPEGFLDPPQMLGWAVVRPSIPRTIILSAVRRSWGLHHCHSLPTQALVELFQSFKTTRVRLWPWPKD